MKYLKYLGIYPNWIFTLIYKYPWVFYITNHSNRSVLRLKIIKFQIDIKKFFLYIDRFVVLNLKNLFSLFELWDLKLKLSGLAHLQQHRVQLKWYLKDIFLFTDFVPVFPPPAESSQEMNSMQLQDSDDSILWGNLFFILSFRNLISHEDFISLYNHFPTQHSFYFYGKTTVSLTFSEIIMSLVVNLRYKYIKYLGICILHQINIIMKKNRLICFLDIKTSL